MMKTFLLATMTLTALAQPVLADNTVVQVKPTLIMIPRDSDGIVISVIHPIDYFPLPGGISTGGHVVYTMGGVELEFSAGPGGVATADSMGAAGGLGPTATVGGLPYKVEVSGNDVWLRDPVTGARYATERHVASAQGVQVNPNGFALE